MRSIGFSMLQSQCLNQLGGQAWAVCSVRIPRPCPWVAFLEKIHDYKKFGWALKQIHLDWCLKLAPRIKNQAVG